MLRVVELFAGIGAQASALERLGIEFESTVCEFEPHAYNGYCAIHGDTPNLGDITKVEHLPECDLLTYSPPCQDISIAGLKRGLEEGSGTRSSLFWEVLRLLKDAKDRGVLPPVLVMENVDAIVNKQNRPHLERFIISLNQLGYTSSWSILNAKDYGVAQNRKRFFMVSTLDKGEFQFPEKMVLTKRLKDYLEKNVPESFYLSPEKLANYERHKRIQREKGNGYGYDPLDIERESIECDPDESDEIRGEYDNRIPKTEGRGEPGPNDIEIRGNLNNGSKENSVVYGVNGICPAILASAGEKANHVRIEENNVDDAELIVVGDLNSYNYDKMNRVYDPNGIAPTIETPSGGGKAPKIIVSGLLTDTGYEKAQRVYDPNGISPALQSRDGKEPVKIIERGGGEPVIKVTGHIGKETQHFKVYDPEGIAPTLAACDSKDPLKIIERRTDD